VLCPIGRRIDSHSLSVLGVGSRWDSPESSLGAIEPILLHNSIMPTQLRSRNVREQIDAHLGADIVVLRVSPDFIDSNCCLPSVCPEGR